MSGIQAPDKETMEACRLYVDNLIKPIIPWESWRI